LGNLITPKRVQKLQMALHAKAKAEAGYRFYALYDNLWTPPAARWFCWNRRYGMHESIRPVDGAITLLALMGVRCL
jgi:hypothetical protein